MGPRIGVFGHPAALRCQIQGPSTGVLPHGCCRGTMRVTCSVGRWVSWENSFFRETVGTRVGGGGVLTMYEQGYDPNVA